MAVHYKCRHCQTELGTIENSLDSNSLGFDQLTSSERTEMVTYTSDGDIHVNAICEDCHEALMRNPDFHELDKMVQ